MPAREARPADGRRLECGTARGLPAAPAVPAAACQAVPAGALPPAPFWAPAGAARTLAVVAPSACLPFAAAVAAPAAAATAGVGPGTVTAGGLVRGNGRRRARRRPGTSGWRPALSAPPGLVPGTAGAPATAGVAAAAGARLRPGTAGWAAGRLRLRHHAPGYRGARLRRALGRAAGPLAQALHVPRLREVEDGQHGQAEHGRQACVGADLLDDLRQGPKDRRPGGVPLRYPPGRAASARSADSSATALASAAASPAYTSSSIRANAVSTQAGSSGGWIALTIFSAGVGCGRSPG